MIHVAYVSICLYLHGIPLNLYNCMKCTQYTATPPDQSAYLKIIFFYFSSKTYVVGTQKNRLTEMVFLSTQNTVLNQWVRNELNFTQIEFPYLDL